MAKFKEVSVGDILFIGYVAAKGTALEKTFPIAGEVSDVEDDVFTIDGLRFSKDSGRNVALPIYVFELCDEVDGRVITGCTLDEYTAYDAFITDLIKAQDDLKNIDFMKIKNKDLALQLKQEVDKLSAKYQELLNKS